MDRFHRGLVAGLVGGVAMNLWSAFEVVILNLDIFIYIDWASVILYGAPPKSYFEGFYALIIQLIFVGLLGVIFAYLMPYTTSRGHLIKGAFYGAAMGLIIYAIPTLLQTPHISSASIETVMSNHAGGLIWGLVMAQTLRWLDSQQPIEAGP